MGNEQSSKTGVKLPSFNSKARNFGGGQSTGYRQVSAMATFRRRCLWKLIVSCRRTMRALLSRRIVAQALQIQLAVPRVRPAVDLWVFELRSHLHNRDLLVVELLESNGQLRRPCRQSKAPKKRVSLPFS
jgi:hypothetical protein